MDSVLHDLDLWTKSNLTSKLLFIVVLASD